MSGGFFNYKEYYLQMLVEELNDVIINGSDVLAHIPDSERDEIIKIIKSISNKLCDIYNVIHTLDYYLSGDCSVDKFKQVMQKLKL